MKKTLLALSFLSLLISNSLAQNNALQFNGNSSAGQNAQYVYVNPSSSDFNLGSNFTFEAWVNPSGINANNTILSKGDNNGSAHDNGYIFEIISGQLQFNNDVTTNIWYNSGYAIPSNTWTHIAVTYQGSTLSFYVNGVLVNSQAASINTNVSGTNNFFIGKQGYACDCNRFNGSIDEVRVWNFARSQSQISANMSCIVGGATTGLIAQYSFNQGIANGNNAAITTLTDNSGNGHTGTLQLFSNLSGGSTSNWTSGIADCPGAPASVVSTPPSVCLGSAGTLNAVSSGNNINWYTVSTGGTALGTSLSSFGFPVYPTTVTTYYAEAATIPATSQIYYIPVTQLYAMSGDCGTLQAKYFPGSGSAGFDWTDVLPVGATITSITVDFAIGVECSGEVRTPTLNGVNQPSLTVTGDCNCNPTAANGVKTVTVSSANYNLGGVNQFRIASNNSFGLMPNASLSGNYARVTVNVVPTTTATSISRTPVTVFISNQEINLQGNAISIAKGDNSPSSIDGTDFGIVNISTNKVQSFTIQNTGISNLSIGGIAIAGTNANSYSVSGISFPTTVAGSSSTSFNLVFTSISQGSKTASIAILNDDCDESYYDFTVSGIADYTSPIITGISPSQTVCSGVVTGLTITALGANLSYQWYKNGAAVAGQTSATISIAGATTSSAGVYFAVIQGLNGSVTSSGISFGIGCNNALNFDGVDDYALVSADIPGGNQFTFSTWFNASTASNNKILSGLGSTFEVALVNGNQVQVYTPNGDGTGGNIALNTWNHLAAVYNNPTMTVYLNGSVIYTFPISGPINTISSLRIGRHFSVTYLNYAGSLDEMSFWNIPLSQTDIQSLMNKYIVSTTTGLTAYYDFNQGLPSLNNSSITTLNDVSNNSRQAGLSNFTLNGSASNFVASTVSISGTFGFTALSITGITASQTVCSGLTMPLNVTVSGASGATFQWYKNGSPISGANASGLTLTSVTSTSAGIYSVAISSLGGNITSSGIAIGVGCNNALDFNGTSSYVYINQTTSIRNLGISGFTLSAWIKPTNVSGIVNSIFRKTNDYNLYINNGKIGVEVWAGGEAGTTYIQQNGTTTIPTNQWSQVTAVWDGTTVKTYINGVLETSSLAGPFSLTGNENLCIGKSLTYSNLFGGDMDELYMWNIPLSKDDIQANYTKKPASTVAGLVAYYNFDQGIASGLNTGITSLIDRTGNGNNGTLNNFLLSGSTSNWIASNTTFSGSFAFLAPTITGISASTTVCSGLPLSFNVTVAGSSGTTYLWYKNNIAISGATSSSLIFSSVTSTNSGTYSMAIQSLGGNITSSGIALIVSNPIVSITASANAVCQGGTINFSGNGATTYTFTGGVLNSIDFTPTISGVYSVVGTNDLGCTNSAFTTITVNSLPNVGINASSNVVCLGQAVTLSGTGASNYTFTGGVLNAVGFVPAITNTYSVTGANAFGCTSSSFANITVNSVPVVNTNDATICMGDIANITALGAAFYSWNNGSVTSAINVSPSISKIYTVVGTSLQGCADTAFATVKVNDLPVVVANNASICIGQSANISATGAAFYLWNNGITTTGFNDSPLVTTSYAVLGTSAYGCSNTAVSTITVNSIPTITASNLTICSGGIANLSATGASTYVWNNGINTAANNVSPLISNLYTVTGTSAQGCSNTAVSSVTVYDLPIVSIDGNNIICVGNIVSLTASGANNYIWSNGSTTTGITVSPSITYSYSVTGFNLNGCSANSNFIVTVTSQPTVLINGNSTFCIGESTTLTGSGANSYLWSNGATSTSIIITPANSQLISVLGIVSVGCQDAEQITLTVNQLPTISISGISTVCSGTLASLIATGASTYVWNNASINPILSINPTINQVISVLGTDLNGCVNTAQTNLFVNTLPSLNLSLSPASANYGASYVANVSSVVTGQTYTIASGSLPSGISLNTATGILSGTATGIGSFGFTIQANNAFCYTQQAFTIGVNKANLTIKAVDSTVYVVNAIPTSFVSSIVGLLNGDVVNVNYSTNAVFGVQGTYAIKVASISSASLVNYNVTTLAGVLTILPRVKLTISGGNLSRTYGSPNTLTGILRFNGKSVIAKEGLNTLVGGDLINLQFTSNATINSKVATGYSVIVTTISGGSDLTKYDIVTVTNGSLQIKPSKITIKAFDYFVNYGDTIPSSFPGTVIGTVLAKDSLRIDNRTDASTVLGVYLITPEVTGDSLSNYSFIVFPGNLYVRYGLTVTGNSLSRNYFTSNPLYSGTVKGLQPGGQNVTVTWISNAMLNSGVGQYPITPVVVGSDLNLYYIISIPGALTVNSIPLKVSANNFVKVTGNPNPALSATKIGLVNGEDVAVSFSTTADLLSSPGEYPIYLTVSGSALANYALTTFAGTLFVGSTTSPITIPAASFTKVYGASEPDYSISLQGIKGNDNVTATYIPDYSSNNGVGIHNVYVQISGTDINKYSFTTTVGVLNITAAPLEIRPTNYTRDYRSPDPVFGGTIIGLAFGDTINVNYISAGNISSDAGNYSIKPFIASSNVSLSNYNIATFTGSLTISKVNLIVRGASLSKIYGDDNPQLAYNLFGFVNNENITEIDVLPQAITNVTKFSDVGKYPVIFQSAFDNNYTFTYLLDSIIVVKSTQIITVSSINAKVKTGETLILTATASSNLPVTVLIDDATVVSVSGSVVAGLKDGITTIRILQSGDTNYYPSDTILVNIVSTSTGIVSNFLFQIAGQDSVLMNTSSTYTMSNKEGYTYKWTYTGKNTIPSQNGNAFTLLFTSTSTDGKVIGQVIDNQGNILKSDSIAVHVITYTDAELAANPDLQDKITAAALVQQLKPLDCPPVVTDCENAYIESFNLGKRINNKSTCSKSGYGDYTTLGKIDSLIMGNSYSMKAVAYNHATDANYFAIWIDYGNDGSFDDPDDFIRAAFKEDTVFELKNVVIRNNDSYIGPRRVRVSMRTTGDPSSSRPASCPQEGTLGETEDYLVYIKKQDALDAPVLISPNDDGKNDLFLVKGINPKLDNKLTVLDRWGKTVFQKEGYENDWGGTDTAGNKLEDGTYFYFFINGADNIKGFFEIRTR